ncbi:MAG: hypothetical protein AAGC68_16170 [Verrucomicrobiota bacterium]
MSESDDKDIQYRGGHLSEEDQEKIKAEQAEHADDVTHVQYRGAEDDMKLNEPHEKHTEHVQYRGAEGDVEV